ncbi:MAG: hypothetical protein M3Y22_17380 [Pseudomonadota bacterium]|nr:hypothetical protein [Pseudomonadota bacterium]
MSDNPTDRFLAADLLSLRAVLVHQGEDPSAALAEAGIVDAVSITVVVGEEPDLDGGILGDGRTPNLIGVLETEQDNAFDAPTGTQFSSTDPVAEAGRPSVPGTSTLAPAYGMQPLAPVRSKRG